MSSNISELIRKVKQKFPLRLLDKEILQSKYEIKDANEVESLKSILQKKTK